MAFPTAVNSQITDAVTQANVKVVSESPAMSMGNLLVATSQALSNSAHNATFGQQQAWSTMQAATTQGISNLLTLETAATGKSAELIYKTPFA